jgi:tetratricopeptide (TPR) repeat protein
VNLSYSLYGKNHQKDYHINPMSRIDLRYPNKDGVVFDKIKILDHRRLPNKFFSYFYYKEDDESGNRRLEIYCPDDKKRFLRLSYQSHMYSKELDSSKRIHNDIDPLRIMVMANNDIKIYSWLGKFRLKDLADHFRDGLDKANNKEFRKATIEFDAVTKSDPKDHEAWFNAGLALELSGELDEAIKRFKAAITAKRDYPKAYCELGNVYIKTSNNEKAIECLNKAIELKPDYALAYFKLGCLQKALGQLDESIVNLNKAIKYERNLQRAQNYKQCLSETLSYYQFSEDISD